MKPDESLGKLRRRAINLFQGFDNPALEADLLLCGLLKRERFWLHAHPEEPVSKDVIERFDDACQRRLAHEPIQYILGQCSFWGLTVEVGPGCLVPRPETEHLVEAALNFFPGGQFLDWGCGSGCISMAILKERPDAWAFLAEKNPQSLLWAWRNLKRMNLLDRALLLHSRHPEDLPPMALDMIVSNPPYIPSSWIDGLMPEVRKYEPRLALDGGEDGLAPYQWLFSLGQRTLKPAGILCVEFGGEHQVQQLRSLQPEDYEEIALIQDCAGESRVFVWRFTDKSRCHNR